MSTQSMLAAVARKRVVTPPSGTEFVTGRTETTLRTDGGNFFTGLKFTVGGSGITVTHLGRWNYSGDSLTHAVYIAASDGTNLGQVSIDASLGTPGGFQYVALGSPVALSASTVYGVVSQEPNGDTFNDSNGGVTTTAVATVTHSLFVLTNGGAFFDGVGGSVSYGPVSFKYT